LSSTGGGSVVIAHNRSVRIGQWLVASCLFGLLLFGSAGRVDLPMYWGYFVVCVGKGLWIALRMDPGLAGERNRPGPGGVDHFTWHFSTLLFAAHWIIAPLDVGRLLWSASVPPLLQLVGLLVFTIFGGLTIWAVVVNRFFSPVVRLQEDRGHHLVTLGPYRFVRHPGYLGMVLSVPASALALGSWLAMIPAMGYALVILRRAILEDQFLRRNLDGYEAYAAAVRYRLVPGLW
jgi:protein-S-isoprenylcysteine O-methyltransferase Ste14